MNTLRDLPLPAAGIPATDTLRELRVHLQLDVRVWGIDALGKPFSQTARTIEISALGARLTGIERVQKGDIIGLQYADAKARFRVVWSGEPGTDQCRCQNTKQHSLAAKALEDCRRD